MNVSSICQADTVYRPLGELSGMARKGRFTFANKESAYTPIGASSLWYDGIGCHASLLIGYQGGEAGCVTKHFMTCMICSEWTLSEGKGDDSHVRPPTLNGVRNIGRIWRTKIYWRLRNTIES